MTWVLPYDSSWLSLMRSRLRLKVERNAPAHVITRGSVAPTLQARAAGSHFGKMDEAALRDPGEAIALAEHGRSVGHVVGPTGTSPAKSWSGSTHGGSVCLNKGAPRTAAAECNCDRGHDQHAGTSGLRARTLEGWPG